jgi:hypothetical protein
VEFLRPHRTTTQVSHFPRLITISCFNSPLDRPVLWTSLAILFAHESEPAVVGRAFPSSRQFRLQSPSVIANTPGSYDPPTILCVSPDENWLFAYFPGRQIPGVGCFWKVRHADGWDVVESISFARGRGVVSAKWLGHAREVCHDTMRPSSTHSPVWQWVADSGRNTLRLPPLGPAVLTSLPTLVLITQNFQVQLCCVRFGPQNAKIATVSCSLEKHEEPRDLNSGPSNLDSPSGLESRYCTHAAIGLGYNGSHNISFPVFTFEIFTIQSLQFSWQLVHGRTHFPWNHPSFRSDSMKSPSYLPTSTTCTWLSP